MKIGVFDSGLGGLTVLRTIRARFPSLDLIYFADTGRCPYGVRDGREVACFSAEIAQFLQNRGASRVVIACNTATVYGLTSVRETGVPAIGMIEAGTRVALRAAKKKVGILATAGTIRSGAYERAITKARPDLEVVGVPSPRLVEMVEAGKIDCPEAREAFRSYMEAVGTADTVVFGCTHFPLYRALAETMYPEVCFVDPADGIVETENFFTDEGAGEARFYTSGSTEEFERLGGQILGRNIKATKIELDRWTKEGEGHENC